MFHGPIVFHNVSLAFSSVTCFEGFSHQVHYQKRIALVGRNGSGKSSLLKIFQNKLELSSGKIIIPDDINLAHIPQIIDYAHLSGGERFQQSLTGAIALQPNLLMLDEPTNHLDCLNKKSLVRMLQNFKHTLIVVTHDVQLLRESFFDEIWHLDQQRIMIFNGSYDDFKREYDQQRLLIERQLSQLTRHKKEVHLALMKEQKRAAKSKALGQKNIQQRKWPTVNSPAKMGRGTETSVNKIQAICFQKNELEESLNKLPRLESINPKFFFTSNQVGDSIILSISNGSVGYNCSTILQNIYLSLSANERVAIIGNNGSGKSTLFQAILNSPQVNKQGEWIIPNIKHIGHLDQHYQSLCDELSVFESIASIAPNWTRNEIRTHLNAFLFQSNEQVLLTVKNLSGGEKVRLSLAQIAAKPIKLLLLDEVTNNIDLETMDHIVQTLKNYNGALLVISHDQNFLKQINISEFYNFSKNTT